MPKSKLLKNLRVCKLVGRVSNSYFTNLFGLNRIFCNAVKCFWNCRLFSNSFSVFQDAIGFFQTGIPLKKFWIDNKMFSNLWIVLTLWIFSRSFISQKDHRFDFFTFLVIKMEKGLIKKTKKEKFEKRNFFSKLQKKSKQTSHCAQKASSFQNYE